MQTASGLWLPCGTYNFARSRPPATEATPFAPEGALLERAVAGGATLLKNEAIEGRNARYAWLAVDAPGRSRSEVYLDSDGFVASPDLAPDELVRFLGDPAFFVRRTGESASHQPAGAMSGFQWNVLFEGIWNSSIDPRVFFLADRTRAREIEESFTLGDLASELVLTQNLLAWTRGGVLPLEARRTFFEEAVRSFRSCHLLQLKWNIEATRRRLFGDTMTLLHRQQKLQQLLQSPDETESRDELFRQASQPQLRGYVMLISAKMPLVDNLDILISDTATLFSSPHEGQETSTAALVRTWRNLLGAAHDNLLALERSLEDVWRTSLLHETEQVRVEAESQGELQRESAHASTGRWFDTMLFVFTLAATAVALIWTVSGAHGRPSWARDVISIGLVVALGVLLYVLSLIPRRRYGPFIPQFEFVSRLDHEVPTVEDNRFAPPAIRTVLAPTAFSPRPGARASWYVEHKRAQAAWIRYEPVRAGRSPDGDSTPHYFVRSDAVRRHIRVDSPSDVDAVARIHVDYNVLTLSDPAVQERRAEAGPGRLARAQTRSSEGFPRSRITAQVILEVHSHQPDRNVPGIWFLREVRVAMLSRQRLEASVCEAVLEIVDAALVAPLLSTAGYQGLFSGHPFGLVSAPTGSKLGPASLALRHLAPANDA